MSLTATLAAHDDLALEALASKGLVRRARRDCGTGLAKIIERNDDAAIVEVDGERVAIDAKGVAAARCSCPANSVCRHVLIAVMVLQESNGNGLCATGVSDTPKASDVFTTHNTLGSSNKIDSLARKELLDLSIAQLKSFAGADWKKAVTLAFADEGSTISDEGASCLVTIEEGLATVTFIAGQGLKGAVCKGPTTKIRLLKSAAALLVRRQTGVDDMFDSPLSNDGQSVKLKPEFIDSAQEVLLEATTLTLSSASPLSADMLFDLAISARAEAAPRVTGALRGLARQAMLAPSRHVEFDEEQFLGDAARTFALLEAIRYSPNDMELIGVLRHDYAIAPALQLLMLGAKVWKSASGARGITAYGYSINEGRWYSVTHARGAGMDPYFSPRDAYYKSQWGTGSLSDMSGLQVRLPQPRIDESGAIANTLPENGVIMAREKLFALLVDNPVAHDSWHEMRSDVASRLGVGLHRSTRPIPVLLAPSKFGGFVFDDFQQRYHWEILDSMGGVIRLELAGNAHELALTLRKIASRIRLILLEVVYEAGELIFHPVSVLFDKNGSIDVHVIDIDGVPTPGKFEQMRTAFCDLFTPARPLDNVRKTGVEMLLNRATAAAVDLASRAPKPDLAAIAKDADTLGLSTLATAARQADADEDTLSSIKLAYVASELSDSHCTSFQ